MGNDIYDRYLIAKNKPEDERSEDDWKVIGDWTKTIFDMDNERPAIMRYEGEGVLYIYPDLSNPSKWRCQNMKRSGQAIIFLKTNGNPSAPKKTAR